MRDFSRYAILLDGGFVRKVLKTYYKRDPTVDDIQELCAQIGHSFPGYELLRNYFYDARPATGKLRNPIDGSEMNLNLTDAHRRGESLLTRLEMAPNFALRLGQTIPRGWKIGTAALHRIKREGQERPLEARDFTPQIEQKGVDVRIGLDIARLSLRGMVRALVIVTGDSDFVPAFKFARREGIRIYLEQLERFGRTSVRAELKAHADILLSTSPTTGTTQ